MNMHAGHRANLKSSASTVWLIGAVALASMFTDGPGRGVGMAAVIVSVVAGQLLRDARWSVAVSVGASVVTLAALWLSGNDLLPSILVAFGVAASGAVGRWARISAPVASSVPGGRQATAVPAEARLPAGVADERLLDRLAIHEMTRARRYEHPLTLLLVDIDGWSMLATERGKRGAFDQVSVLAVRIRRLLRDVDAIGLHGDGQLAILLPETPLDGALVVAGRIEQAARDDVGVSVRVGAAVFPEDAVSVDGLLHEAEAALELARLEGVAVVQRVQLI